MLKQNRWITLILALVMLATSGIAAIVIAAPPLPWELSSADPGTTPQVSQPEVVGDAPDENGFTGSYQTPARQDSSSSAAGLPGPSLAETDANREPWPDEDDYTGPVPNRTQDIVDSSANADIPPQPDWSTFYAEPQLDDNVNGESLASVGPQWSPLFYYVHVAGSALRPRDSSVEWGTSGSGGCLYNVSGSTSVIFNVHLDIPDGSRIDYLRIYYYDDDTTNNSRAWVTSYDDEGGLTDVVTVASDGDTGYGTMLSAEIAHVVDMLNNSYVLNWRPYASGNMALCGLRVAYRLPD